MFLFSPPEDFDPEKQFEEVPLQQGLLYMRWKTTCGHSALRFALSDTDDRVVVFVQCIGYHLPLLGTLWIASHGPLGTFPSSELETTFFTELQKLCKKQAPDTIAVRVGRKPQTGLLSPAERGASALNQPPSESRVSLEPSLEEITATFAKSVRQQIRVHKQKESGVRFQVEQTDYVSHLPTLTALLHTTATLKGFSAHPKKHYEALLNELNKNPEYGTLILGYLGERKQPSSFLLMLFSGTEAYHLFSGNSPEGYAVGLPTLTLYTALKEAKKQKVAWFNLGAYYTGTELALRSLVNQSKFKEKFRGEVVVYPPQYDLVESRVRYLLFRFMRWYPLLITRRTAVRWCRRVIAEFEEEKKV